MGVKVQAKQPVQKRFSSLRELSQQTGQAYKTLHKAAREGRIKTLRLGGSVVVPLREVQKILKEGY
jgi:hypothetical protein